MARVFHLWIFLIVNILFVSSIALDIFYPDDFLTLPEYDEYYPRINSLRPVNSNKFGCKCQRPCQCQNQRPPPLAYNPPPVHYSPPAYQLPTIPTQQPIIIPPSPPIYSPAPPAISPPQQIAPNFQTSQDQTKYNSVNYEHSHSETQQNPGRFTKRRSSLPHQSQIYSQINFPDNQYYNNPNRVRADYKRSADTISIRRRNSRGTLESSEAQNGNDVAPCSSIIPPQQQLLINTIDSNSRNKRHNTNPVAYGRGKGNNYTVIESPPKTRQFGIVNPPRKLVIPGEESIFSQSRSSSGSPNNIYVNYPHGYVNNEEFSMLNGWNNKNMFMDNARSSGSNGIKIFYPPGNVVYSTHVGQRESLGNSQITPDYYNRYIYTKKIE